jgi:hypothetical protein
MGLPPLSEIMRHAILGTVNLKMGFQAFQTTSPAGIFADFGRTLHQRRRYAND